MTVEIPASVLRRARARVAERGISMAHVTEAVEEKLTVRQPDPKPWMKMVGGLQHLHRETKCINRLIEEEFERIA